jgi:alkylation response protein AidB-like acyl-CoA dehydrogenase
VGEGLSFSFTEEQRAFQASIRQLTEDKIAPRAQEIDASDEYPWDIDELLIKNGFAAVSYPEQYGGVGGRSSCASSSRRSRECRPEYR